MPSSPPVASTAPCRTRSRAPGRRRPSARCSPRSRARPRLVRRYGTDADLVLATAREVTGLADDELLAPVADSVPTYLAELVFGVTHEGAADVGDLPRPAVPWPRSPRDCANPRWVGPNGCASGLNGCRRSPLDVAATFGELRRHLGQFNGFGDERGSTRVGRLGGIGG